MGVQIIFPKTKGLDVKLVKYMQNEWSIDGRVIDLFIAKYSKFVHVIRLTDNWNLNQVLCNLNGLNDTLISSTSDYQNCQLQWKCSKNFACFDGSDIFV